MEKKKLGAQLADSIVHSLLLKAREWAMRLGVPGRYNTILLLNLSFYGKAFGSIR